MAGLEGVAKDTFPASGQVYRSTWTLT